MLIDPGLSSLAEQVAALSDVEQAEVLQGFDMDQLLWDWSFWGRPAQQEPEGEWNTWLILAGRGFGKTRAGAEWVKKNMTGRTPMSRGRYRRMAIICETAADARHVMVEGESGILSVHPSGFRPDYQPALRKLTWPNGATAQLYNAVEPDQLRGPQHDAALCDELAKWRYAQETWDQLQFGLRLGEKPRVCITTTPRPIPIIHELHKQDRAKNPNGTVVITKGSTYENRSNVPPAFLTTMLAKYEGTRLGRQELRAEVLDDIPGALWTRQMLDALRLGPQDKLPDMARVVVGVDPSGTKGDSDGASNEVGIVVAGRGVDGHAYVMGDYTCDLSPEGWGRRVIDAYKRHEGDRVVAETNYGGAMVEAVLRSIDGKVSYKSVTASRGKVIRAEPIAALYEQGKVHHCGAFPELEDQLCAFTGTGYVGEGSPDRGDAAVWALTELMLTGTGYRINL
jgi:phage terminase large subunit-like protein